MKYLIIFLLFAINLQGQDIGEIINKYKESELTFENVSRAILELQIDNPVEVFKQTIKESGWVGKKAYKSLLATKYNNLFGMRKAARRITTAQDKTFKGYAIYGHWIYSIVDYKYWQDSKPRRKMESHNNYLIRRGYARNTKGYVKVKIRLPERIDTILKIGLIKTFDYKNVNLLWLGAK